MTVAENMGFALKMAKVSKEERTQKVKEVAELLGLVELFERYPKKCRVDNDNVLQSVERSFRRPKVFCFR